MSPSAGLVTGSGDAPFMLIHIHLGREAAGSLPTVRQAIA
jgi:hypothetical protein